MGFHFHTVQKVGRKLKKKMNTFGCAYNNVLIK